MSAKLLREFEDTLSELHHESEPLVWASALDNLGHRFIVLGYDPVDIAMLEESVAVFEATIDDADEKATPQGWAIAQNHLAAALHTLGMREEKGIQLLENAVEAYKCVLRVWTRQKMEDYWGTTFNNLGTVLQLLGEMKKDQRSLQMSIATFNNALTVQKREKNPKDWAITKNNLGVSLQVFGELQQDPKILLDSLECYQGALEETSKEKNPVGWMMIMANLAATQRLLAEISKEREIAQEAVNNFDSIVAFLTDATDKKYLELAKQQQANAQATLVELS